MTEYVVSVRLKADGSGLVGEVKLSADALKALSERTSRADAAAGKAAHATRELTKAQKAATEATERGTVAWIEYMKGQAAYDGLLMSAKAAYTYAKETMMLAARHEELGVVMAVVGRNAGYTSTQMAGHSREVRAMGITMIESRNTVVQLAQAEIDLAHASQLARAAQDAAVIGVTNSSDALQRMIYGIKSGQTDVLRTMGINVNFEQSYKRLATELHKTTEALSEKEKMQAREAAVLDETAKVVGVYEEAMGTAGKQMRSMARYTEDLKVMRGEVFNEALTVAVMAFVDQLKDANKQATELSNNEKFLEWGRGVATTLAWAADMGMSAAGAFRLMGVNLAEFAAVEMQGGPLFAALFRSEQLKAIREAADEDRASIIASMSMFKDALEQRRTAHQADVDKRIATDKDYVARALAVQRDGAKASIELQQLAQLTLAKMMYPREFPDKPPERPGGPDKARAADDYDRLIKSIREKIQVTQLDLQTEEKLTEGQKIAAKFVADLVGNQLKAQGLTQEQIDAKKRLIAAGLNELIVNEKKLAADEKARRLHEALADLERAQFNQALARAQSIHAEAEALEFQAQTIGMTKNSIEGLNITKLEARALDETLTQGEIDALNRLIQARKRLYSATSGEESRRRDSEAARVHVEEWKRANEEIGRSLTDTLMRGFESGKTPAQNLRDTVVNMFKTMVLRPIIQATLSPISMPLASFGQGVVSGLGFNAAGGAAGSYAASAGSAVLYSTIPGIGGEQAAMLAAQTADFGVAGYSATAAAAGAETLATLAVAAPYAAAGVAALYALGAFSDDEGQRNPWMSINSGGQHPGQVAGRLSATETDLRDSSPQFWAEVGKWIDQLPERLKAAVDNMGMIFEPGTSAAQAWAAMHAQIEATAKSIGLTTEEMKKLQPLETQRTQIEAERASLQQEYNQLTLSAARLEELRIDALDESNRALARNVQHIKDQHAALDALLGGTTSLAAGVRDARSAMLNISDIVLAFAAEQAAAQQDLTAVQRAAAQSYGDFADSIAEFLRITKSPTAQFSELKDLFAVRAAAVKGGDTESLDGLLDVARQLFGSAEAQSTDRVDFARRTAGFRATLMELEAGAKARATALTPAGQPSALSPIEQGIKDAQDRVTTASRNTADALALVSGMTLAQRGAMSGLTDEIVRYRGAQQSANDAIATLAGLTTEAGADMRLGAEDAHKLGLALGLTGASLTLFEERIVGYQTTISDFSAWMVGVNSLGPQFKGMLDAVKLAGSSLIAAFGPVEETTLAQRTAMSGLTDEIVRYRGAQQSMNDAIATLADLTTEAGADMRLGAEDAHKLGLALGLTGTALTLFEERIAQSQTSIGDFSAWLIGVNSSGPQFKGTLDAVKLAGSDMIVAFQAVDETLRGVITNLSAIQMPTWTPPPAMPPPALEGWANGVYHSALGASYDSTANILTAANGYSFTGAQVVAAIEDAVNAGDLTQIYRQSIAGGISSAGMAALLTASGYATTQEQILRWTAAQGLPSFAEGTDFLPRDMIVQAHYGERITPAAYNRSDATNAELVREVKALRETVARQQATLDRIDRSAQDTATTLARVTDGNNLQVAVQ